MKILFSTLFLFISISLFSQNAVRDVIYLNNGNIIRGNILEITDNKIIKIESCENILVYDMSEVQKVTKEELPVKQESNYSVKSSGFVNMTSFGILAGPKGSSAISPVTFETVKH